MVEQVSPAATRALHRLAKRLGVDRSRFERLPRPQYVLPGYACYRRAQNEGAVKLAKREAAAWRRGQS